MTATNPTFPKPFEDWLNTATRGLCDHAREQIQEELSDHYVSALEEELERGATQEIAEGNAVQALGDPRKAHRRFRKIYLTRYQDTWINRRWQLDFRSPRDYRKPAKLEAKTKLLLLSILSLPFVLILFFIFFIGDNGRVAMPEFGTLVLFLIIMGVAGMGLVLAFSLMEFIFSTYNRKLRYPPHKAIYQNYYWAVFAITFCMVVFLVYCITQPEFIDFCFVISFGLFSLYQLIISMRVAHKLKKYPKQNHTPVIEKMIALSDKGQGDELKPS